MLVGKRNGCATLRSLVKSTLAGSAFDAEPLQGFLVVVCNSEQKCTANGSTLLNIKPPS
jgi:hypothetical protein